MHPLPIVLVLLIAGSAFSQTVYKVPAAGLAAIKQNDLKNKFYTIAIFNSDGLVIPNYLKIDSTVIFINEKILGYD